MQKRFRLYTPAVITLMVLSAALTVTVLFFNRTLFYICAAVTCVVFIAVLLLLRSVGKKTSALLAEIGAGIAQTGNGNFTDFPMPVVTVHDNDEIVWYNDLCASQVFEGREMRGESILDLLGGISVIDAVPGSGYNVDYGGKLYTAWISRQPNSNISVVYLSEDTQLKHQAREYVITRPSIALVTVDNYEEMMQDYSDVERAQLMGRIETVVEQYFAVHHGFATKIARDRFMVYVEQRGLDEILSRKFDLLDRVRGLHDGERMHSTLSIGIGRDAKNLAEAESMARQALDMCLGRGGDQAAVKTQNGYEFYGGVAKGIEKRTKVKTRIIASALGELIESAGNVLVMGHRFADLDSLGASVGIYKSVKAAGRPAVIMLDRERNLVGPLLDKLLACGYGEENFIHPSLALDLVDDRTLLIIVDTHVPHMLESEQLYRTCRNVVVIDHHRKLVDHIDNAVIFYHEPYASSASEMVAELAQYFPARPQLTRVEAEAMMAGIMLDTKNFVLRTGVRTFEAAAWLRRMGADTVEVRKLFASSMDAYQQKASLVATAEVYHGCAIAVSDVQSKDIQVIAPQAADELMTISGVDASFIIFQMEKSVNISARSLGAFNVQVLMEKMGGGGHQTMAAAQFADESIEDVRRRLMEAIEEYCQPVSTDPNEPGPESVAQEHKAGPSVQQAQVRQQ